MATASPSEVAIARDHVRTLIRVRWLGIAFALVQVLGYDALPYPAGIRQAALAIVAAMAAANLVFALLRPGARSLHEARRLGLAMLAVDVLALSGIVWVYAFDGLSAIFAILFLLPIEAAVLFGLPGALWTWGAVAVLYTGREWFGVRYGNPFEVSSLTFRVGLIGIVALIVGLLVRDLVAQRRATARALAEAERSEASRSRLISMLAHDVRAPIAAARSALDTLRVGGERLDPEQRAEITAAGRRQADRALLLARDLLDLARVEAGTLVVATEDVDLEHLLGQVRAVLAGRAEIHADLAAHTVRADPQRLEQVLFNLLDNAVRHGAEPIEVSSRGATDEVVLAVRDHGPGVDPEVDLFTAFATAGEGSVGLGLWIVGVLVEAMGGSVHHEPADPGARFVVRLPAGTGPVRSS